MNNTKDNCVSTDTFFKKRVESMVGSIPMGKVMTYSQIAALCGSPRAARVVGGIAHHGDSQLPWHRVVNKQGGLARGYLGGFHAHARHLARDGVKILEGHRIDIDSLLWRPDKVDSD